MSNVWVVNEGRAERNFVSFTSRTFLLNSAMPTRVLRSRATEEA